METYLVTVMQHGASTYQDCEDFLQGELTHIQKRIDMANEKHSLSEFLQYLRARRRAVEVAMDKLQAKQASEFPTDA